MKKEVKILLRGVGVGLIVAATLFYGLSFNYTREKDSQYDIRDEVIIERAKNLGMVFIKEPIKKEVDGEIDLKP